LCWRSCASTEIPLRRSDEPADACYVHLETLLAAAAHPSNWAETVRRCAWCGRIADRDGNFGAQREHGAHTVTTDGMCLRCGCKALALVAHKREIRLASEWAASLR
jgi:hypothetical protein